MHENITKAMEFVKNKTVEENSKEIVDSFKKAEEASNTVGGLLDKMVEERERKA